MRTKSADECRRHYFEVYVDSSIGPLPDSTLLARMGAGPATVTPRSGKSKTGRDQQERITSASADDTADPQPKRAKLDGCGVDKESSGPPIPKMLGAEMAGYLPMREEFGKEYNNEIESLISGIVFYDDDTALDKETKLAMVDIYNRKLDEREARKVFCIEYGLIDHTEPSTDVNSVEERLKPYARYHSAAEHKSLCEAIRNCDKLRHRLTELHEYRSAGLQVLSEVEEFTRLANKREQCRDRLSGWRGQGRRTWGESSVFVGSSMQDPDSLPEHDLLSEAEAKLCSENAIFPEQYIAMKTAFVQHAIRTGGLSASQAVKLAPIETQKALSVYAFMLEENLIVMPE